MEGMKATTVIVNDTSDVLKLKVGGHQSYAELATIAKQGRHDLHVSVNETYREFLLQAVGGSNNNNEKAVVVSSDDCCDNECITIKEADSGKLEAHRVARKHHNSSSHADAEAKKAVTWFGWLRQLWAHLK